MAIRPAPESVAKEAAANTHQPRDPNTLSNYNAFRTKHTEADFEIDFNAKRLKGTVHLTLEKLAKDASKVILDSSYLEVSSVKAGSRELKYDLSTSRVEPYGSPLTVAVPETDSNDLKL
ncbi:hypothetical protein KC324_g20673, partial [Hortaea werneckii]